MRRPLHLLKTAPRELWLVYVLKALDSYGYFALSEVFTMSSPTSLAHRTPSRVPCTEGGEWPSRCTGY